MNTNFSDLPGRINVGVDEAYKHRRFLRKMRIRLMSSCIGIVLGLCGAAIHGQMKVRYFSEQPNDQAVKQQCLSAGVALRKQLDLFPHPEKWTWLVVCDESSWPAAMKAEHVNNAEYVYGSTYFDTTTTILRGSALRGDDPKVTAEHLVSHELAHIALRTADEYRAEALAKKWMNRLTKTLIASSAPR